MRSRPSLDTKGTALPPTLSHPCSPGPAWLPLARPSSPPPPDLLPSQTKPPTHTSSPWAALGPLGQSAMGTQSCWANHQGRPQHWRPPKMGVLPGNSQNCSLSCPDPAWGTPGQATLPSDTRSGRCLPWHGRGPSDGGLVTALAKRSRALCRPPPMPACSAV